MQTSEDGLLWYAVYVRTRFEKVVARNLRTKGYEEFLPLYRRASRWSDRIKHIDLPLFPGYVFCRFKASGRRPILTIPGVKAIVGFGNNMTPVDERELNAIRAVLQSGNRCEPWPFLRVGQQVQVERGPLAGTEGVILTLEDSWRLVISVNTLQRSVAVEVDQNSVRPISGPVLEMDAREHTVLTSATRAEETAGRAHTECPNRN